MKKQVSRCLMVVLLVAALGVAGPLTAVIAQQNSGATTESSVIAPGNIDIGISGGLNGLAFPYIEPQVAVGVVDLGQVSLSAGAIADAGYCVLCHAVDFLTDSYSLRAYYIGAYARALVHLGMIAEELGSTVRLDPYAGLAIGPRFYFVNLESKDTNDSASARLTSIIVMPHVGTRVFLSQTASWFLFGDIRMKLEAGIQTASVRLDNQRYDVEDDVLGFSMGIALGAGLRM